MAAVATAAEYKEAVPSLEELQERRAYECRLTPDRALETLDDAAAFLRDRGLLTRTTDCALPSLHEACHEEPYQPGRGRLRRVAARRSGAWGFELGRRDGVYALKIHRGKTLFLSAETAALADPICRAEIERMEAEDEGWALLLRHLGNTGPSLAEDVQRGARAEAEGAEGDPLAARALRRGRRPRFFAGRRRLGHASSRAGIRSTPSRRRAGGLDELVVAGVRAAVVCPEREPKRWFSWTWRWEDGLVDRLVDEGDSSGPEPGWLALP